MDDYSDFAVTTAKEIVKEEDDRIRNEIVEEVSALMDVWMDRLATRIIERMDAVGIPQRLEILGEWSEDQLPKFKYIGTN